MQQQALKMIGGMMAIGIVISLTSGTLVPLIVFAVVAYVIWQVARGFDG